MPSGTFGNEERNDLRGPGWQALDLSLARSASTPGRVGLDLRWDVFNVFNTVNFGLPNADLSSATVGTITSSRATRALMQFSLGSRF